MLCWTIFENAQKIGLISSSNLLFVIIKLSKFNLLIFLIKTYFKFDSQRHNFFLIQIKTNFNQLKLKKVMKLSLIWKTYKLLKDKNLLKLIFSLVTNKLNWNWNWN